MTETVEKTSNVPRLYSNFSNPSLAEKTRVAVRNDIRKCDSMSSECSNFRCIKCDFKCEYFQDNEWGKGAEYIFFRNNMPNRSKLSAILTSKSKNRLAHSSKSD